MSYEPKQAIYLPIGDVLDLELHLMETRPGIKPEAFVAELVQRGLKIDKEGQRVWALLGGEKFDTEKIDRDEFFCNWVKRGLQNKVKKLGHEETVGEKKMSGFLLPFEEKCFSTYRLG